MAEAFKFKTLQALLRTHIEKGQDERKEWDRYHAWYMSEFWEYESSYPAQTPNLEGADLELETNFPYGFIDTMIANICPSNPLISLTAEDPSMDEAAKARESLINDTLRRGKMHAKSWDMATFAAICGTSFSKTVWDERRRRPVTRILNPRNIFYDQSNTWEDCRYVIEAIPIDEVTFKERVTSSQYKGSSTERPNFSKIPSWLDSAYTGKSQDMVAAREVLNWAIVYEVYDFRAGIYYHMLEGAEEPLAVRTRPYMYMDNPYSQMIFNKDLLRNGGVSDIKLIAKIQERLNEIDSLELWFAHTSIPIMLINEGLVDNIEDALSAIQSATGPGMAARLNVRNERPIGEAIDFTRTPQMSPSFGNMRERCVQLIEFVLGLPAYARGAYEGADVATAVALADTSTKTRNGRRIKVIEDWIEECSKQSLAIWKQKLDSDRVIPMRDMTTMSAYQIDRGNLAFPKPDDLGRLGPEEFDEEWYYRYEAVPFSPAENNRLVKIQKVQQFIEYLTTSPHVDQAALGSEILELLQMSKLFTKAQPQMGPGGPVPGGANNNGTEDTIASGAVPGGVDEDVLPPEARQMADQPVANLPVG